MTLCTGKSEPDPKPPEIASDVIKRRGDDIEKNKKAVRQANTPPIEQRLGFVRSAASNGADADGR